MIIFKGNIWLREECVKQIESDIRRQLPTGVVVVPACVDVVVTSPDDSGCVFKRADSGSPQQRNWRTGGHPEKSKTQRGAYMDRKQFFISFGLVVLLIAWALLLVAAFMWLVKTFGWTNVLIGAAILAAILTLYVIWQEWRITRVVEH